MKADTTNNTNINHELSAIGRLAGSVSNEFNNWLSIIHGYAESIADSLIPNTRAHGDALRIIDATKHAGNLTRRLASISKATKVKGKSKIKNVNSAKIVQDAISLTKGTFSEKDIHFRYSPPSSSIYVSAEYSQLVDCMVNIFFNSADAMPKGGSITIDIIKKTYKDSDYGIIRVRDTGHGMNKDTLNNIFDPFFTTKEKSAAIGLGLTMVHNIIDAWGGFIKVKSQPDKGTSMRIFIPLAEKQHIQETERIQMGGETIVIIDDSRKHTDDIANILMNAGYIIHTASNAKDGIAFFKKNINNVHLLIVDLIMPDNDGRYVMKTVMSIDPTTPIIITSGFSRDYVRGYLDRGTWGFIQKPAESDHVLQTVRRHLNKSLDRNKKLALKTGK